MYLDFEDHRPETPSVSPVISRREGVLLSLVLHLTLTIVYLLTPEGYFDAAVVPVEPQPAPQEDVRFVMMEPLMERNVPPPPRADASDLDRRAATIERPPVPENTAPLSRGNTPEKVLATPPPDPQGGDRGAAGPTSETPPPAPDAPALQTRPTTQRQAQGEGLARSLRNLQQYVQQDNYANPRGGAAEQDAQISFDAKGVDFGWWLRRFVTHVKSNWNVPTAAHFVPGQVHVTFNVHRNGFISDITLVQGSGHHALDLAALNALRASSPTVPLPTEYPDDKAFFRVTFIYTITR